MEPEWVDNFPLFRQWVLDHLGEKPSPQHSLDRADNDDGYYKHNLQYATKVEQQNNRRSNLVITFQGITMTLKQHCDRLNLAYGTITKRLYFMGWSVEDALSTPIKKRAA